MFDNSIEKTSENTKGMLIQVFHSKLDAERAYEIALKYGYTKDDVSILMSDETRDREFTDNKRDVLEKSDLETKSLEGLGAGSLVGGAIGGVAAAIAAIGTVLTIPGLGLVIAGPIAAGLAGAGAGSIAGGIAGSLIGAGMTSEGAAEYEKAIKEGKIVLSLHTKTGADYDAIKREWVII